LSPVLKALILSVTTAVLAMSFYSMNSGITITNDGSHFALVNSLIDRHSPELQDNQRFALNDSAVYKNKIFSDRNPGLGLFAYAFYQCFKFLSPMIKNIYMDPYYSDKFLEKEKPRVNLIMIIPALSGALTFLGLFFLLNTFNKDFSLNFFLALSFILGTILLRYSTVFYSHILASALVVFSFLLFFKYVKEGGLIKLSLASFCLGFAVVVEYIAVVLYLPLSFYLLFKMKKILFHWKTFVCIIIASAIPAAILLTYNYICFDNPLSIAHFYHSRDHTKHSIKTLFVFQQSIIQNYRLLFGAPVEIVQRKDLMGLLTSSPFLLFIFLSIPLFIRKKIKITPENWTAFAGFACVMFFASSISNPYGGWDRDYRYFCIAVPLLAPLLATVIKWIIQGSNGIVSQKRKIVVMTIFSFPVLYSISKQLDHIRHIPQKKYPTHFINFEAAIINIGLFFILFVFLGWLAYLLIRKMNSKKSKYKHFVRGPTQT
jgi:hypothetical protein